jgi:para-aminobenzoate synthetase component 1
MTPAPDPWQACQALSQREGLIFFDSALRHPELGRYSFLAASPVRRYELTEATLGSDPFAEAKADLARLELAHVPDLPPFQGGIAGVMSYELNGCFERIETSARNDFEIPLFAAGLYDWVIAWDHETDRAWIMAHGINPHDLAIDSERARRTVETLQGELERDSVPSSWPCDRPSRQLPETGQPLSFEPLPELRSDFSRDDYLTAVERVVEYIHAGDIFQANLSQQLSHPLNQPLRELYGRLRTVNPATYSGLFLWDDWAVASASPERFLQVKDRIVETRPIKGTRRRGDSPEAELFTGDELRESSKDMAENVMIADLLRNDLSRVCAAGSVHASELCRVETYATVQHLVSVIRGRLRGDKSVWDLLSATFPGGSITGAPKVRAMEIIAELEPTVRGPYCGSLFYLGHDGSLDSNILIRTFIVRHGSVQCRVGGGITAKSSPEAEYAETLHKAEGMLRALVR